jgi:hypothetical protein
MFRERPIPVDLSSGSRIAFAALSDVAAPEASVELLQVVEKVAEEGDPEFALFYRAPERKAEMVLRSGCEELPKTGFSARAEIPMAAAAARS